MKRIICITGAASGIGRDTAKRFAEMGDCVIACDRDEAGLAALQQEVGEAVLEPVVFDLRDRKSYTAVEDAMQKHGRLDVLVNSAGITSLTPMKDISEDEWDAIFDINLKGAFFMTRMLLPYLEKSDYASIVNLCSVAGFRGGVFSNFAYSTSKGAVNILTKNFAKLLAPQKIRVNQVAPDVVLTPMVTSKGTPEMIEGARKAVPLGELTEACDVSAAIVYLAGPDARYITGQTIHINGGNYIP